MPNPLIDMLLGGEDPNQIPSLPGLPPIQLTPREKRKLEGMPGFVAPPGRVGQRFPAGTPPELVDELYGIVQGPQGLSEPHLPGSYDRTRPHIEELLRNQALHQELLLGLEGDSYYPEDPESPSNLEGGEPARKRRWLLGKGERAQRRAARQAEEQAMLEEMGGPIPAGDIMVGRRLRQGLPIDPRVKLAGRRGSDFVPDDPSIWGVRNAAEPRRHSGRQQF